MRRDGAGVGNWPAPGQGAPGIPRRAEVGASCRSDLCGVHQIARHEAPQGHRARGLGPWEAPFQGHWGSVLATGLQAGAPMGAQGVTETLAVPVALRVPRAPPHSQVHTCTPGHHSITHAHTRDHTPHMQAHTQPTTRSTHRHACVAARHSPRPSHTGHSCAHHTHHTWVLTLHTRTHTPHPYPTHARTTPSTADDRDMASQPTSRRPLSPVQSPGVSSTPFSPGPHPSASA